MIDVAAAATAVDAPTFIYQSLLTGAVFLRLAHSPLKSVARNDALDHCRVA